MAESKDSPSRRSIDSDSAGDDVYDVLGDTSPGDEDDSPLPSNGSVGELDLADAAHGMASETGPSNRVKGKAPVAPLPRLWRAEPEPGDEEPPSKSDRSGAGSKSEPEKPVRSRGGDKGKSVGKIERGGSVRSQSEMAAAGHGGRSDRKKPRSDDADDDEKKALVEETPTLDTYEARQYARVIFGAVSLSVCLVVGLIIYSSLRKKFEPEQQAPPPDVASSPTPAPVPAPDREGLEQEARLKLDQARAVARAGKVTLAIDTLKSVVALYPGTKAAAEAKEALERPARNLPLFSDTPTIVVTSATPTSKEKSAPDGPKVVVNATSADMAKPTSGEFSIVLPANASEPRRGSPSAAASADGPVGKPLPKGFRARPGTRVHLTGWALEIVGDRDGAPMVLVPGGESLLGRDDGDAAERPAHRVRLSTYYIDQHEVTVRQYELYQKEAGRRIDRDRALARESSSSSNSEDAPVVMVNIKDARDYATWAEKRLPTEAQWERAARGTDGRIYPWGTRAPEWGDKRKPRQIDVVESFPTDLSPFGAFDMAGNAWEWTSDWFDPRYYYLFKTQVQVDPTGPTIRPRLLQTTVRGSSNQWNVTKREGMKTEQRLPHLGFRCVLQVEGADNAFETKPKASPGSPAPAPGPPSAPAGAPVPF